MAKILNSVETINAVDQLGMLQAQIAELSGKADAIKTALAELPRGAYEGNLFRASVSVAERSRLDMDAVKAKLSAQFMAAHTTTTMVTSVRVSAKITGKAAA